MSKSLAEKDENSYDFNTMAYLLKNTVSDHGYVSRGECQVNKDGYLVNVTERTHIEKTHGNLMRKDDEGEFIPIDKNTVVSMNFWSFTPKCFEFVGHLFEEFLEANTENLKAEFFLPSIVNEILKSDRASVEVLKSEAKWFGVTYKEDKAIVQKVIEQLKNKGIYPKNLW